MDMSLFALLGTATVFYLTLSYVLAWYRLRHIKGPTLASFSYLWMFRTSLKGTQSISYRNIIKQYGSLVRIGPNDVITDDPEVICRMNGARSRYSRSGWYEAIRMDPYYPSLFALMDTSAHDKLKAQLSFGYGGKENPTVEQNIEEQLANLTGYIRRRYLSTATDLRPMDLATVCQYFTLDTITRISYGKEFGYLETDSDVYEYIKTSEEQVPFIALTSEIPPLASVVLNNWVLKLIGPKTTDKKGLGPLIAVAQKIVADRFEPGAKDHNDMLGSFIRHGVHRRQCESEVLFQIIAGSDTTATAIRGTMLDLISSPLAYMKLRNEIDSAAKTGRISNPAKMEETKHLKYLQAVIFEGLRMNPTFSGLQMKQVPLEGDTIHGKFVPGGTRVGHSILALQRLTTVFGPDAEVFKPERWLGGDEDKKREMMQIVEMSFGYGRFGCSGKPVALMELNKIYVELFRNFDFQLVDPKNPIHIANHNMFFEKHMWVKVTERIHE